MTRLSTRLRSDGGGAARANWWTGLVATGTAASAAISAVLRALGALAAGFALTSGAALILWAFTPTAAADTSDALDAIRSGSVAFGAAHFLPITISGSALTLRPLLLTGVVIAIIATAVGRGRSVHGRGLEALHAAVFVVVYAMGVAALTSWMAPSDAVDAQLLPPAVIAALVAVVSLAAGPTAWRAWWIGASPPWLRVGLHAVRVGLLALICGAAVLLAVALATSFPDAAAISELTVRSFGDGVGMVLLMLAFLPNAIVAAIGYASGAGFSLGEAAFSPLAVQRADLPAVPILAAAPDGQPSALAWAAFVVPVLAGLLAAAVLRRAGHNRLERLGAVAVAAVGMGVVVAGLAWAAGGGVAGGDWENMGASPLITGALIAGMTALIASALAVTTGWAGLPWRILAGPMAETAAAADVDEEAAEVASIVISAADSEPEPETESVTAAEAEAEPEVGQHVDEEAAEVASIVIPAADSEPEPEAKSVTAAEAESQAASETDPAADGGPADSGDEPPSTLEDAGSA